MFYRTLAKIVEKYVHKGDKLYVEGKIRYRFFADNLGKRRFVTEIYVDNMEMLTLKSASAHTDAPAPNVETKTEETPASDSDSLPF